MNARSVRTMKVLGLLITVAVLITACQPKSSGGTLSPAPGAGSTPAVTGQNQPPEETFTVSISNDAKLGKILVDSKGLTLYTFKNDSAGVSNCAAGCIELWPPLTVSGTLVPTAGPSVTGKLEVIERSDGAMQVTYNGMPLYTYVGDSVPGDTNGQGIDNLWYAATP